MDKTFPRIPDEEFSQRVEMLKSKMNEKNVDIAIGFSNLLDPSVVRYFTDFSAVNESSAVVITKTGEVTLCSGQASTDYALIKNRLKNSQVLAFPEVGEVSGFEYDFDGQMNFRSFFMDLKAKTTVTKIALMGKLIFPAVIYNSLTDVFPNAEIVYFDDELYEMRVNKSQAELAVMEKCASIISQTFSNVIKTVKAGMTELDIQAMLESEMLRLGGESYVQAFAPMVATGPENSFISMYRSSMRQVKEGEILNIAAGVCYEGYNAIICTPHVIGKVPTEIRDAIKCAYEALNIAYSQMAPGVHTSQILNSYTDHLSEKGYIQFCPYGSLHSTGMLECEAPLFSVENDRILKENMAICIDSYFKGMDWGSFRIEDCYIITKNGVKRTTTYNDTAILSLIK